MHIPGLEAYELQGAVWAGFGQSLLQERVVAEVGEDYSWSVEVPEERLTFTGRDGRTLHCHSDLIASFAPGPQSMMWTWNMGHESGEGIRLRQYGQQYGIDWLTSPEVKIQPGAQVDTPENEIRNLAHRVAWAVEGISGRAPYYTFPNGNDGTLLTLLTVPDLPAPRINETFPRRLDEAVQPIAGYDQRPSVHRLGELSSWTIAWTDEQTLEFQDPFNTNLARIHFNQQGQMDNIQLRMFSPEEALANRSHQQHD